MKNQKLIWEKEYISKNNIWARENRNAPAIFFGKEVLELGVGNGKTLLSIMRNKPKKVSALDFSNEALKICEDRFANHLNYKALELKEGNLKNLPFKDESFDVVVAYYVFDNLCKKERLAAAKEIWRVLKKTGKVLFEDFAVGDFREKRDGKAMEMHTVVKKNGLFCHFFTKEEVVLLFDKFKKIKISEIITKPIKSKANLKRKIISGAFEKLAN